VLRFIGNDKSAEIEMRRLWRVCTLSRGVFDEMMPKTPILLPLLLIVVVSLILWLVVSITSTFQAVNLFGGHAGLTEIRLGSDLFFDRGSPQEEGILRLGLYDVLASILRGMFEVVLIICLKLTLLGTYFYVVGRLIQMDTRWGNWFGFACWIYLPMVIASAATTTLLFFSLANISSIVLLSFFRNALVILPVIWSFCIAVQGLRSWTSKDTAFCVRVALVPYTVIGLLYFLP